MLPVNCFLIFELLFLGHRCTSGGWSMDKRIPWVWLCDTGDCWGGWSVCEVSEPLCTWRTCNHGGEGILFGQCVIFYFGLLNAPVFFSPPNAWKIYGWFALEVLLSFKSFVLSIWSLCGSRLAVWSSSSSNSQIPTKQTNQIHQQVSDHWGCMPCISLVLLYLFVLWFLYFFIIPLTSIVFWFIFELHM